MKKAICLVITVLLAVSLSGCKKTVEFIMEAAGYEPPNTEVQPDYDLDFDFDQNTFGGVDLPEPEPHEWPEPIYTFGEGAFLEYGKQYTDIEYNGNMFNEIYNYGEPLSALEIEDLQLSLRYKEVEGGELVYFLEEYCVGEQPYIEPRAVTVNGQDEPYRHLYVRLYYAPELLEDGSYSEVFDQDLAAIRVNCSDALIAAGYDTLTFSMHIDGEMRVMSIITQQDGSFVFD